MSSSPLPLAPSYKLFIVARALPMAPLTGSLCTMVLTCPVIERGLTRSWLMPNEGILLLESLEVLHVEGSCSLKVQNTSSCRVVRYVSTFLLHAMGGLKVRVHEESTFLLSWSQSKIVICAGVATGWRSSRRWLRMRSGKSMPRAGARAAWACARAAHACASRTLGPPTRGPRTRPRSLRAMCCAMSGRCLPTSSATRTLRFASHRSVELR